MKVVFVDYIRTSIELGRANMIAVPREGERVSLELSCPFDSRNPLMFAHFIVKQVEHDAKNTMKVEEWMNPYDRHSEAGMVMLHVLGLTRETREYAERVIEREDKQNR